MAEMLTIKTNFLQKHNGLKTLEIQESALRKHSQVRIKKTYEHL